jgi:peptidoglycan/xylan/chitin deacetylase (PgdA/CDA1 family)
MLFLAGAVAMGVLSLAHTAPFAFLLEAFHRKESAWHLPTAPESPVVYLTYDDGPNPTATPLLLDVLKRENVHATFFLIDDHLSEETAPIVQRMFAEGHAVGLHSNERWLMLQSAGTIAGRLELAANKVEQLGGSRPCRWFRPHAGWRSGTLYEALEKADYRLAGWSFGLWDWNLWRSREADALADRLARRARAGDIIVIHDGHHVDPRADRQYAVDATARLIPLLRARQIGFERFPCAEW